MVLYIQLVCHKFVLNIFALFTDAQNALSGEDNSIAAVCWQTNYVPTEEKKIVAKTFHHFDILRIHIRVRYSAFHITAAATHNMTLCLCI